MATLLNPAKEIKTRIGKAKVYLNKHQAVRCMAEVLGAIKIHIVCQKKLLGTDKIEIEYSLDELMNGLNAFAELQPYLPEPLSYKRGNERASYMQLLEMLKRISADMQSGAPREDPEAAEAKRKQQALLDKLEDFLLKGDQMMVAAITKKLLAESGGDSGMLMDMAERYYKSKDWKGVIGYALDAIRKNPKEMRAYKLAINAHRNLKEYEQALGLFKQALGVFGHHPNIYINLAKLYYEWGKPKKAQDCARMALKLDPANEEAARMVEVLASQLESAGAEAAEAEGGGGDEAQGAAPAAAEPSPAPGGEA